MASPVTITVKAPAPPPPNPGTVSASTSGDGKGSVELAGAGGAHATCTGGPCSITVPGNSSVTLTATADKGSHIKGWTDDCKSSGTDSTCTLTVPAGGSKTASVQFDKDPPPPPETVTLTLTEINVDDTSSGGKVTGPDGTDCQDTTCTYSVIKGDTAVLHAHIPNAGTKLVWSGACVTVSTTCTLVMDGDKRVTATFSPKCLPPRCRPPGGGVAAALAVPVTRLVPATAAVRRRRRTG
jgi:hypothetical protein